MIINLISQIIHFKKYQRKILEEYNKKYEIEEIKCINFSNEKNQGDTSSYRTQETNPTKTKPNPNKAEKSCSISIKSFIKKFINISEEYESFFPICLKIIYINISLNNYFSNTAYLFSDKYISLRYLCEEANDFQYILTKEYDRYILVFFIVKIINFIIKWLLDSESGLKMLTLY